MNLSVLRRMAHDVDLSLDALRYLLNCRCECEYLDYKESLDFNSDRSLCGFARDAIALKNVGGGYLVVGVKDQTWEPIGLTQPFALDSKALCDQLRRATGLDLSVLVVTHRLSIGGHSREFALLHVRGSAKKSKRRSPTLVNKDFAHTHSHGLRRGEIYFRRCDQTIRVATPDELDELLAGLDEREDQNRLEVQDIESSFAIVDGPYRILERGFDRFVGRSQLRSAIQDAVTKDPRIWIINVHGPGGVGKSALVNWATHEFYANRTFEAILQLTAKDTVLTEAGIQQARSRSLYSLETLLDHIYRLFDDRTPVGLDDAVRGAIDYLSAWSTLLVLDNMETVADGRILKFLQELPPTSKCKVLLTSRQRTGGWELPVSVRELSTSEAEEFVRVKSEDLGIEFPKTGQAGEDLIRVSGGLPLALQWMLGQYRLTGNLHQVLDAATRRDAPILEFSFRNMWNALDDNAREVLGVMTIFEGPPTLQDLRVATDWPLEKLETALEKLQDATLITRSLQGSDGRDVFVALPITLSFARHQLEDMGETEILARRRRQLFLDQMSLEDSEVRGFRTLYERYGLETDNERRSAVLCRRGESAMFGGDVGGAEIHFMHARELAPQSAYVFAMSANFEMARRCVGEALRFAQLACVKATKHTGRLAYGVLARVKEEQNDKSGVVEALGLALEFASDDNVLKHQYGVALSRCGRTNDALIQFDQILELERAKQPPRVQMLYTLKSKSITLKRAGRRTEARAQLEEAKAVILSTPGLQHEIEHFADLWEEEGIGLSAGSD